MLNKISCNSAILILLGFGCAFLSASNVSAQTDSPPDDSRIKNFGWSLKQFDIKKDKNKKPKQDKKQKDSADNQNDQSGSSAERTADNAGGNQNQEPKNKQETAPTGEETIRVETNLTTNDVLVVDKSSRAVNNLQAKDFIITEDGVEQKPELFSFGENLNLPRSIVLIFYNADVFYSAQSNYIGAITLIDKLAPEDKMAIVTPDLKLTQNFTADKNLLKNKISAIAMHPIGGDLADEDFGTLIAVLNEMFTSEDTRPIVILQALGGDIWGMKTDQDFQPPEDKIKYWIKYQKKRRGYGFDDVREAIERSRATIYSIIPELRLIGLPKEEQLKRMRVIIKGWYQLNNPNATPEQVTKAEDEYQEDSLIDYVTPQTKMMEIAELGGGYIDFLEVPTQGDKVYSSIFADISNRYTIGYYPTNQAKDGRERSVKIEVRGHPEYTLLYKEKYLPR